MLLRAATILCLTLTALALLAIPLSGLGLTYSQTRPTTRTTVSLASGALEVDHSLNGPAGVLDRNLYSVRVSGRPQPWSSLRPMFSRARNIAKVSIPLLDLFMLFGAAAFLLLFIPVLRQRRRTRRSHCLACGYHRAADQAPCPECGRTPDQSTQCQQHARQSLIRNSLIAFAAAIAVLCTAPLLVVHLEQQSLEEHRLRVLDYSWYLDACQPHLFGSIAVAEPGTGPNSILNVLRRVPSGSVIILLPGNHDMGGRNSPSSYGVNGLKDTWIIGAGRTDTTLSVHLTDPQRVRFDNLTIECWDDPFMDTRQSSSIYLRNCRVMGYNSGAGGSNAVYAQNSALLVDSCEFDGRPGRQRDSISRGEAFDLRGDNRLYARKTVFQNNDYIFRTASAVLDHCTAVSDQAQYFFSNTEGVYSRDLSLIDQRSVSAPLKHFTDALDDPAVLERLADPEKQAVSDDPTTNHAAQVLHLRKDSAFWMRLLLHPDPKVRALAAAHQKLPPLPPPVMSLDDALQRLDGKDITLDMLAALSSPDARPRLEAIQQSGTRQQQTNAAAVLQVLSVDPPVIEAIEREGLRPR